MSSLLSPFGISYFYHLRKSASQTKYSSQVFLTATPLSLLNFPTPNRYPISYYYQVLMSPYDTVAAQTTPYRYSFQLFSSSTPSYSCQLLLSATRQLLISYLHQLFLSGTFISSSYLLYLHTPIRYSYQKCFVTNHCQHSYHILPRSSCSQRFFKIGILKNVAILVRKHLCWCLFLLKRDSNTDVFS